MHQPRLRRTCIGELIQIDGSEHHWFEDRGPACTLLVYVDDATSRYAASLRQFGVHIHLLAGYRRRWPDSVLSCHERAEYYWHLCQHQTSLPFTAYDRLVN